MRVVNIVAKLRLQPKVLSGSFLVDSAHIKIFGADEPTASLLLGEFPELKYNRSGSGSGITTSTSAPSTSSSSSSASSSSKDNEDTSKGFLYTAAGQEEETMELEQAIAQITRYLNVLDQQEFTVVAAFKDEITDHSTNDQYKMYVWTMQK